LDLLGLPTSLYTSLQLGGDDHHLNQEQNNVGQPGNLPGRNLANCATPDQHDEQLQLG